MIYTARKLPLNWDVKSPDVRWQVTWHQIACCVIVRDPHPVTRPDQAIEIDVLRMMDTSRHMKNKVPWLIETSHQTVKRMPNLRSMAGSLRGCMLDWEFPNIVGRVTWIDAVRNPPSHCRSLNNRCPNISVIADTRLFTQGQGHFIAIA